MLYLQVVQTPRSSDSAIFMLTSDKTNCFTPCACAWGNDINCDALNHASVTTIIVCVTVCVCVCMSCMVNVYECACMCV